MRIKDLRPLVDPAEYLATLDYWEADATAFKGQPKVYLNFTLLDPGVMGIRLYAAHNIKGFSGARKKNPALTISRRQDLALQLAQLFPDQRADRLSLNPLLGRQVVVRARVVDKDYKQRPLPPPLKYSVVDWIMRIVE